VDPNKTALILIGYQNDYFANDGILHQVIEETSRIGGTLKNTIDLLERLKATPVLLVSTPIIFTPDYRELVDPVGILKTIVEVGAFKAGEKGSETIPELCSFEDRSVEVPGKRGLNAFSNTELDGLLKEKGIKDVLLAGVVTSICIDSTGRSAFERGYNVSVLSDCTSGRSVVEQDFYLKEIFPIYANVLDHGELLKSLGIDG